MTDQAEADYYKSRAIQSDELADRATDPSIKQIHRRMATDYRAMALESRNINILSSSDTVQNVKIRFVKEIDLAED